MDSPWWFDMKVGLENYEVKQCNKWFQVLFYGYTVVTDKC